MLALEPLIKDRLRGLGALAGWAIRGGTQAVDRRPVPVVDVRMDGAVVAEARRPGVTLRPAWAVSLVTRRSDDAAEQLDCALRAVIECLHGWVPCSGWTELTTAEVRPVLYSDGDLCGYEVVLTCAHVFHGQQ